MLVIDAVSDLERCRFVAEGLGDIGFRTEKFPNSRGTTWRVAPRPLTLPHADVEWLRALGGHLHKFNIACSYLYHLSVDGRQPGWIAGYLDRGKPASLVEYSRMRQFRRTFPCVIRPDVIPTPEGRLITELDSVPGGMGLIARATELYKELGCQLIGEEVTLPRAFAEMAKEVSGDCSPCIAIVISEESDAYRPEMTWLAKKIKDWGIEAYAVAPEDLSYSENGVKVRGASRDLFVSLIFRNFELFDLGNISNVELLMRLNAQNRVQVVPPFRPIFEEKMWMALFHHPVLTNYWQSAIGNDGYSFLRDCFPPTWILDPEPVPPHATIPGLLVGGSSLNSWTHLENLGRSQRHFVIKPSGFSERSWGSRGVVIGHDISTKEWNTALAEALGSFAQNPHVLQEFQAGRQFEGCFYDTANGSMRTIPCRVRLSPFFLVVGNQVKLTSVMATMCPLDKKKIHGMPEAIITPCTVEKPGGI